MSKIITIRFQRKNTYETVSNYVLIGIGCLLFYFASQFPILGFAFFAWGIISFSKSKGLLVDPDQRQVWTYNALLWMKNKRELSLKDIESVMVTTGTIAHTFENGHTGYMVYKLYLLPDIYTKKEKVFLEDFWTKEECLLAAEALSKATQLPLVLRIR